MRNHKGGITKLIIASGAHAKKVESQSGRSVQSARADMGVEKGRLDSEVRVVAPCGIEVVCCCGGKEEKVGDYNE